MFRLFSYELGHAEKWFAPLRRERGQEQPPRSDLTGTSIAGSNPCHHKQPRVSESKERQLCMEIGSRGVLPSLRLVIQSIFIVLKTLAVYYTCPVIARCQVQFLAGALEISEMLQVFPTQIEMYWYETQCWNRILKAFANSLDPDETPQNVASHLDPNLLLLLLLLMLFLLPLL
ncbi:hypothetical protein DPMN_172592 [Dreissena polymorpha]|uniref:Uncharacterized protein n=1 Tax=Dreissena polymorpha TaxID=45954 RepID=A0A9D4E037_DREPO|nr:hypothetical protein DPMN_172592 [Dreissena polymorpha]